MYQIITSVSNYHQMFIWSERQTNFARATKQNSQAGRLPNQHVINKRALGKFFEIEFHIFWVNAAKRSGRVQK